ncbi:MAG: hypothetical protein KC495_05355 [Dehalococcoidia bacterium]|nr:hypothetical protein [Dehalococcoidia bacterium]MCB9486720.1 hypothetical protein [Thermoflexaceae bacterium]
MTLPGASNRIPPPRSVNVRQLAWLLAATVFVLTRVVAALNLPVFGAELVHLSGAWQASIGVDDARFIPTLFQGLSALQLEFSSSEAGPRVMAVGVSCSVPVLLWLYRSALGHDGALAILLLLAIEPFSVAFGATASAIAFDGPVAIWVLLILGSGRSNKLALAVSGFAGAVCGPAVLFVLLAWLSVGRTRLTLRTLAALLGGFIAGAGLASFGFGFGPVTPVVPALSLLAAGSEQAWSTGTTLDLVLLYSTPLLLAAVVAVPVAVRRRSPLLRLALGWGAFALAWALFSIPSHNPAAAAGLTLPLCVVTGFMAPRAVRAIAHVRRAEALPLLAGAAVSLVLAWAVLADWSRVERTGDASEQFRLALYLGLAAIFLAVLVARPVLRPALFAPLAFAMAALLLPGAAGLVAGGTSEPLVSPISPAQARKLRDLAVARRDAGEGDIVIHPSLQDAITWPFRGSGVVVVASVAPKSAAIVLWPTSEPAPEGFVIVEGNWALTRTIRAPTADLLDSLHWFLDRNTVASQGVSISVYTREQP